MAPRRQLPGDGPDVAVDFCCFTTSGRFCFVVALVVLQADLNLFPHQSALVFLPETR